MMTTKTKMSLIGIKAALLVVAAILAMPLAPVNAASKELYGITENQSAKYKKLNVDRHYRIRKDGADHFITFKVKRSDVYELVIASDNPVDVAFNSNTYTSIHKKSYIMLLNAKEVVDVHITPRDKDANIIFRVNEVEAVG